MRVGYLVPEFPGQTHIMFWRELAELRGRGATVDVVSTRRPASAATHEWSTDAARETTYLFPFTAASLAATTRGILRAGPRRWVRWGATMARSEGFRGLKGRARVLALGFVGATVAGIARKREWSHLHVHSCADSANIALFAACLGDLTYSVTLHGPLADYGGNQRLKWQRAAFGIVITEQLRDAVTASLHGALPESVHVAGMGVDPARLTRSTPYCPWRPGERARLFCCARLNPAKGHLDLLAAVAKLRADGLDAELVIAGEDDAGGTGYRTTVEQCIEELELVDAVRLLGAVPESEVRRQLEAAHIFVLASHAEPLGVAVMEALAMATPVVATRAGGLVELIADGINGVLVPPGAPALIAAAVRHLLDDPELADRLSREGRATVVERFTSGRNAALLLDQIERVGTS